VSNEQRRRLLLDEIRRLRTQLEQLVADGRGFTDANVLHLSRRIDQLVLRYHGQSTEFANETSDAAS
jgi:hypothetical protein